jgi:hypothetical protein
VVDSLLSLNVFGYQTSLSFISEFLFRHFLYRDLQDLAPPHSRLSTSAPTCNDQISAQIRAGKAHWLCGDIESFETDGISFNHRDRGISAGGLSKKELIHGAIAVLATDFSRPDPHFMPDVASESPYAPSAWYLQTFPPEHPWISAVNSMYINALGTVRHIHIGIYTRTLLVFLQDLSATPTPKETKRWIDRMRWLKQRTPSVAFDFFTYSEMLWFLECVAWKPQR